MLRYYFGLFLTFLAVITPAEAFNFKPWEGGSGVPNISPNPGTGTFLPPTVSGGGGGGGMTFSGSSTTMQYSGSGTNMQFSLNTPSGSGALIAMGVL
jgi:hypothetical protein